MVVHQNHVNERFHNGISVTDFAEGIFITFSMQYIYFWKR